jgi:hypothetical protein
MCNIFVCAPRLGEVNEKLCSSVRVGEGNENRVSNGNLRLDFSSREVEPLLISLSH